MAARLIHFGIDDCYRLRVLRTAGYDVEACGNLLQLREALASNSDADAVMVNDSKGSVPLHAISVLRSSTSAPIILFPHYGRNYRTEEIDLVVRSFARPEEWLLDLANLIVHSRAIRSSSQLRRQQSELLRHESAAVCETAIQEVQRSHDLLDALRSPSPSQNRDPRQT